MTNLYMYIVNNDINEDCDWTRNRITIIDSIQKVCIYTTYTLGLLIWPMKLNRKVRNRYPLTSGAQTLS